VGEGVRLRELTAADGDALAALAAASADTGRVAFLPEYACNPLVAHRALRPGATVVGAEGDEGLVGAAAVSAGRCLVEGREVAYALLYALAVHPDRRRQGIARALTDWRLAHARERHGEDVVVLANIQSGNAGSVANARAWARQIFGRTVQIPHRVRRRPPALGSLEIRAPERDEWAQAAAGLNVFYRDANLHVQATAAALQSWTAESPFPTPFRHYRVAVDSGEVVAGAEVVEQARLFRIRVERVPPLLRLLAIGALPSGDVLQQALLLRLWHAPGRAAAGRTLWEALRHEVADRANTLITTFDPRGPLAGVVPARPWMPKTTLALAVRAPVELDERRAVVPLL